MTSRPARLEALAGALLLLGAALPANADLVAGLAALRLHHAREARVHFMNAVRADPRDPAARLLLARTALLLGDGVAAAGEIGQARSLGAPAATNHHLLAEALLLQGQAQAALAEADSASIPARYAVYAARIRARAHAMLGENGLAAVDFSGALRIAPGNAALWVDLARFRRATGETAGAIEASAHAVELDPRDPETLLVRGQMVRDQFGLVASLPWFDQAIAIDPGYAPALIEKAATLGDLGRYQAMLAACRAALAIDPGNARIFYLQSVTAARAGRFDLARAMLNRVGERLSGAPGAMLLSATLSIHEGAFEQAADRLDDLLDEQPDNLAARRLLGLARWRAGDPAAAIEALAPLASRGDSYALLLTGRAHERLGDRAAAAPFLDRAAVARGDGGGPIDPATPLATLAAEAASGDARAVARYVRGLLIAGNGGAALAEAQRLLRGNPGAPGAHMLVGDVLVATQRWGDAAHAYRDAASLQFSEGVALRLADAQARAGDAAAGAATLSLFLAQNPRSIPALNAASDAMLAAGAWAQAEAVIGSVRRRIGNGDLLLLNNAAWAANGAGDQARALRFARLAFSRQPASPALADTLGAISAEGGDRAYGVALIEQALAIASNDPAFRQHLVRARSADGEL